MDHCKDSENVIMHSILCVKLEPFDEDEDCTQNIDPLQPYSDVHAQMELLQDFKMEIETDVSDQAMNKLIQENILKNDPGDTGTKIEEINIKTEYIGDETSTLDDVLVSRGIIEDGTSVHSQLAENISSKYTDHRSAETQKRNETNSTTHELSHSCGAYRSSVIKTPRHRSVTNDGCTLIATSPANHSRASTDSCSSGVDGLRIYKHSTSEGEGSNQSSSLIAHSLLQLSYICDVCDKKFKNARNLVRHKVVHTNQKPHVCDVCKKGFNNSSYLVKHKRIHTGQKPHVCDFCKKGFIDQSGLVKHKRIHTGEKPYVCDFCKRAFSNPTALVTHKRIHTGEKPYICDICKKEFAHSSALTIHKRIHTGQKPYVCDICKKGFGKSSDLVKHKYNHTGQKPHVCDLCKKGFIYASQLVIHKITHTGEKPYVCDICKKRFSQASNLFSHKRTHHDQKPCA